MTWRIPPVGYCALCLAEKKPDVFGTEEPALVLWEGKSLCGPHLRQAVHGEVLEDREKADSREVEVGRVARVLMDAWARAEGKPVTPSYIATFADMARAVVEDRETDA